MVIKILNSVTIALIFVSCGGDKICEESELLISSIGNELIQNENYYLDDWMDTDVHEIEFKLNQDMTLCGIGYKSLDSDEEYQLSIKNKDGIVVLNEFLTFNSDALEIKEVENIVLKSNTVYTVSRECMSCLNASSKIGQMYRPVDNNNQFTFPVQNDKITILNTRFYGNGGAVGNWIPLVELAVN